MTMPRETALRKHTPWCRVTTASRLHFGLLAMPATPGRAFGGAGLMVRHPGIQIECAASETPSVDWRGTEAYADRIRQTLARLVDQGLPALAVRRAHVPAQHVGLGTGTQLAVALAAAAAHMAGRPFDANDLAQWSGRARRSAIGLYGFLEGGFVIDGGKGPTTQVAPKLLRADFPEAWGVVLLRPDVPAGLHGDREQAAFDAVQSPDESLTETLCRRLLLGVAPAVIEADYDAFGEALFAFNRDAGRHFANVQRSCYAHAALEAIVIEVRRWGIPAVGQSSWGPTLFAITADRDQAEWLAQRAAARWRLVEEQCLVTAACNEGASLTP